MCIRDSHDGDDAAGPVLVAPGARRALHHVPGAVEIGVDDRVPVSYTHLDVYKRQV